MSKRGASISGQSSGLFAQANVAAEQQSSAATTKLLVKIKINLILIL